MSNNKKFEPQLTLPSKNDKNAKYYITKSSGGLNPGIKGNNSKGQRHKTFDILPNCVPYAAARFCSLANDPNFSLIKCCNAEDFITYADKSLKIGATPALGAIMVWSKGKQKNSADGCGHVAVVEQIISDTEVVASQSGWSSNKPFWVQHHQKGSDGNWGLKGYKFLGFIYNPAESCQDKVSTSTNTSSSSTNKLDLSSTLAGSLSNTLNNVVSNINSNINSTINTNTSTPKTIKATKVAQSLDKSLSGKYKVISTDGLNMRNGASVVDKILVGIPYNSIVSCYGYYSVNNGVKWLYVQWSDDNGVNYTGFCSEKF